MRKIVCRTSRSLSGFTSFSIHQPRQLTSASSSSSSWTSAESGLTPKAHQAASLILKKDCRRSIGRCVSPRLVEEWRRIATLAHTVGWHLVCWIDIKTRVFGQDRPNVANSKYNIALLHKGRHETEKARQVFLECEKIYATVHGPDHSATVDAARQASGCV